jgi:hypothetical protein
MAEQGLGNDGVTPVPAGIFFMNLYYVWVPGRNHGDAPAVVPDLRYT